MLYMGGKGLRYRAILGTALYPYEFQSPFMTRSGSVFINLPGSYSVLLYLYISLQNAWQGNEGLHPIKQATF